MGPLSVCTSRKSITNVGLVVIEISPVKAKPTAPEPYICWFWKSVTGRPVMKGVEEAKSPS